MKILNSKKILHRDIKPANIFLHQNKLEIKIGDFNIATILSDDLAETQIGTPYYLAPEIWKKVPYDKQCDVFSLGCLLFEIAALKHPFQSQSKHELYEKIFSGKI